MPPRRGEVWLLDLGMTAKTRPVLIVSVEYGDIDRAIVTVVPHTTQIRPFRNSGRGTLSPAWRLPRPRRLDLSESVGDPKTRGASAGTNRRRC